MKRESNEARMSTRSSAAAIAGTNIRTARIAMLLWPALLLGACGAADGRSANAGAGTTAAAVPAAAKRDWAISPGIPLALGEIDRKSEAFRRFRDWVDSAVAGRPGYAFAARDAAVLYRITPETRYCALAVRMVDTEVTEAEAAIAAGRAPAIAGDSYLEVGPRIADLALTLDTCKAQVDETMRKRWSAYAEQTVWNVWHPFRAQWGGSPRPWSGWSVDNPGNNYHYSFLEATLYWALASGQGEWMRFIAEDKLPALKAYYAQLEGGGSREGTGYGTAQMRLFAFYRLWRDATGEDLAAASPHARDTIDYWVHATVPSLDRFAPIGDQSRNSMPELYDYHRRLMLEARSLTGDAAGRDLAAWWLGNISVQRMQHGFNSVHALLPAGDAPKTPPFAASGASGPIFHHAAGAGHLFARSDWSRDALWLAVVAGPYTESHAHQDQGGFTLFGGDWLAVTANVWTRSGIQQSGEVHNVLRFERDAALGRPCRGPEELGNPRSVVPQCEPSESSMTATAGADGSLRIDADLSGAYRGNPAVRRWTRRFDLAGRTLRIEDRFETAPGTDAIFQLQLPVAPTITGNEARAGRLRIRVLAPTDARLSVRDWQAHQPAEFNRGWRLDIAGGSDRYLIELSDAGP